MNVNLHHHHQIQHHISLSCQLWQLFPDTTVPRLEYQTDNYSIRHLQLQCDLVSIRMRLAEHRFLHRKQILCWRMLARQLAMLEEDAGYLLLGRENYHRHGRQRVDKEGTCCHPKE